MNIEKVINQVITPEMDEIIQKQELIGMRISGGIDSAFMTYLMMSAYPNKKLLPVTMFNKLRPAAMDAVLNVESKLRELLPDSTLLEAEVAFFDTSNWKKTKEMIEEFEKTGKKYNPKDVFQQKWYEDIFKKYPELNVYMSGETLNPPVEEQPNIITDSFSGFPNDRNFKRNLVSKREKKMIDGKLFYYDTHKYEIRPFRNMNKKEVAGLVKELGLDKTLFPVTETCETEIFVYPNMTRDFNMSYTNPGAEPCKRCWPCREKYWAYGYYDFNNTETVAEYKL
tara:strand:+ start:178 stop:1023 length:846 start_codon:yes stop_codon:yes gene_type:complete